VRLQRTCVDASSDDYSYTQDKLGKITVAIFDTLTFGIKINLTLFGSMQYSLYRYLNAYSALEASSDHCTHPVINLLVSTIIY